jgi:hypothetical protein
VGEICGDSRHRSSNPTSKGFSEFNSERRLQTLPTFIPRGIRRQSTRFSKGRREQKVDKAETFCSAPKKIISTRNK